MIRIFISLICFIFSVLNIYSQGERTNNRSGNKYYKKMLKDTLHKDSILLRKAKIEYLKAITKNPESYEAKFNLANVLFKEKRPDEAIENYKSLITEKTPKKDLGELYFNIGNCLMEKQDFQGAIDEYKKALRKNPKDLEAKYNLEIAKNLLKQNPPQKNKDKNKDNKDQNKNNNNKDQNKDNKDKKDQNKDNSNKEKYNNKDQKGNEKPQPNKISKQDAERMLKAIEGNEKGSQKKMMLMKEKEKKQKKPSEKDW